MSPEMQKLVDSVTRATTVMAGADIFIAGLKTQLDAAIAALPNKQQLTDLSASLGSESDKMEAAIAANTPGA